METKAVRDQAGGIICSRCRIADNPWTRLRGLLGRSGLNADEGLLVKPTNSIHMMFMRFPIDAVFLDRDLAVLRVVPNLKPWRIASQRRARMVLELPAGTAARTGIQPGNRLSLSG